MANGQETDTGDYSALSRAYKADPTIENYVALRRKHPTEKIEVAVSGGLEWLFQNQETLKPFGIPAQLVAGALDADAGSISELSLLLLERIIERKRLVRAGKTHVVSRQLAISDELVNYLINLMLDSLDWNNDLYFHRDLIVLIRHQTGGGRTDWDKLQQQQEWHWKCAQATFALIGSGKVPTIRAVAKELGVSPTTVMRWYPEGELAQLFAKVAREMQAVKRKLGK